MYFRRTPNASRVAAAWAHVHGPGGDVPPSSDAWFAEYRSSRPSVRVAARWEERVAYRERKDKIPGKRKLDMRNFLKEEGDRTIVSPLTGHKIKMKTLTGPQYKEDTKSQLSLIHI